MAIMTEGQEILARYFLLSGMEIPEAMYLSGILWSEEATTEMLKAIAENQNMNRAQLYSTALEISIRQGTKTENRPLSYLRKGKKSMRAIIDKMLKMKIPDELIEGVITLLDTEEQYEKMSLALDRLQNLNSTTILGKALLISEET